MRKHTSRRGVARLLIAGALMTAASAGFADDHTALFKIVTAKDEIVVALSAEEIRTLGGNDVTHIGQALKTRGELTVWQYAVRKSADGELEQAPRQRVSVLGHESLRVEPYSSPLRVVPVPAN
jgi:hypothetical protein